MPVTAQPSCIPASLTVLLKQPVLHDASIFVDFVLPLDLVYTIEAAHEVDVTFQFSRDAPIYYGFREMRVGDGAKKMPGVLRGCL